MLETSREVNVSVDETYDGWWTHACLVEQGFALSTWDQLAPAHQTIPEGYLDLTVEHVVTVGWIRRMEQGECWAYVRIIPGEYASAHTLMPGAKIPPVERPGPDARTPSPTPVPAWAKPYFAMAKRWILRLYAHTPIALWTDTKAAQLAADACARRRHCRAVCTAYAALHTSLGAYALQIDWEHSEHGPTTVCLRVERERNRMVVTKKQQRPDGPVREASRVCALDKAEPVHEQDAVLLTYARQLASQVDRVRAAIQEPPPGRTPPSPAPITPRRRTQLYALEQRWYHEQAMTKRPF